MRFISAVGAVAIVAAAIAFTPDASAQRGGRNQATTVVVVNYQRVLAESALGRDVAAKLQTVRQQVTSEAQTLQPEAQSIEQERQRLATATRNMTPDQVRANSNLNSQVEAFNTRMQQFQQRGAGLQGDVECTQVFALREFNDQVSPVVRSIMESRGAGVVLDSNNIQFVSPEYDITATVIQQLDQTARTSNVTRHAVTECQAPQQAGQ
jgi:Skp family chaperone for outer membrane proteins